MNRRHCLSTLGALTLAGCASPPTVPAGLAAGTQRAFTIEGSPIGRMWVVLPAGYAETREPWPLLVFLHGSGERGTELDKVLIHGPPKHAAKGRAYPFVVVSPQLGDDRDWEPNELHALLGQLRSRFNLDPDRIYCTGLSRGGHGTWNWASHYPGDLAAVAPVCGYGDPALIAATMKRIPVRAYHGDQDPAVPIEKQQACVDALRAAGGDVSFTVYPGVKHDSWNQAYEDPGLVPWLLSKKRA